MIRLIAILGIVAISFSAVFVRLASVEPVTAAFFRCAYALPVLGLLWFFQRRTDRRSSGQRWAAVLAGVFLGIDLCVWHRAIELIGAGMSTVLGNTQVIFVGLVAWWLHGERPSRTARLTVPVMLLGVAMITGLGRADAYGSDPAMGVVFGLLTGMTYSIFLLIFRAANRENGHATGSLLDATAGAAGFCLLFGLLAPGLDLVPAWPAHGWLLAVAIGSQSIGWLLIAIVLPRLPALGTSVMLLLQPALTVLWGMWLFQEFLSPVQWAGVGLVLGGVGLVSAAGSIQKDAEPARQEPVDELTAKPAEEPAVS